MSHAVLFLPGIMGSELRLGNETVWPPKPAETVFGYKRIDKLQSPDLRATNIIRNVACFGFYDRIFAYFDELGYRKDDPERRLIALAYDWRLDLFVLADQVADFLDTVKHDRITITAHSMGGLVARIILESGKYNHRDWFEKIDLFVAMSTPHNGAPLALARALGLDSSAGISARDFKTLTRNPKYPAAYQLLPAPGEHTLWDIDGDGRLLPLDFYDKKTAKKFDLSFDLIKRAKAVHECFAQGGPPEHIRYFYFAGTGHKTLTRINVILGPDGVPETMTKVMNRASGDGTVPIWSSLPRPTQKQLVVQEHATVFRGEAFKNAFFQLFGVSIGPLDFERLGQRVEYSVSQPIYHLSEPENTIEVLINGPNGISALNAQIVVEEIGEDRQPKGAPQIFPMAYDGPPLNTLTLDLEVPEKAGFYRLIMQDLIEGASRDIGEGVVFSVTREADDWNGK